MVEGRVECLDAFLLPLEGILDSHEIMDLENEFPSSPVEPTKGLVGHTYHRRLRSIGVGDPIEGIVHPAHEEPPTPKDVVEGPGSSDCSSDLGLPDSSDLGEPFVIPLQEILRLMFRTMYTTDVNVLDVYTFEAEDPNELLGTHSIVRGMADLFEAIAVYLLDLLG